MAIINFFPTGGGGGKDIAGAVVTLGAALEYNGSVQTQTVSSVVLNGVTLTPDTDYVVIGNTGTDVGSYQLTVLGFGNYGGYVTAVWTISKKTVAKPTVSVGTYTYDGSAQGPTITGFDSTYMTKTGDSETDAGNYTLSISLIDANNCKWSDDSITPIAQSWSIGKATPTVTAPTAKTGLTYDGSAKVLVDAGGTTGGELQYSLDGASYSTAIPTRTNAGTYTVYYKVVGNANYNDVAANSVSVTISKATLTKPTITAGSFTYNGSPKTPTVSSAFDSSTMVKGGDENATNAGNYELTISLLDTDNYQWSGGGTAPLELAWSIAKASRTLTLSKSSVSIKTDGGSDTVTATYTGDGTLSAQSSATGVATASVSAKVITVNAVDDGTATITVTIGEGTNYLSASATFTVSVDTAVVVGVMWTYSNSSTALTRLTTSNDPNGYVNTDITTEPSPAVGTGAGSSPFDSLMPWNGMVEYNVVNNAIGAKKGDSGFSRTTNDTVVYIPTFYCKIIKDTTNKKWYGYISNKAKSGFTLHPGSNSYVGRYHTINSSGYYSRSGAKPVVNMTRATARTNSHSKGADWYQWGLAQWNAIQLLYVVEFADWNSQAKIGQDYTNSNSASINTGGTDTMTYHTGRASGTDGKVSAQYRWIEGLWGNVLDWLDGINFNSRAAHACTNPANFADDTTTNYTAVGITLPSSNYITELGVSSACPWAMLPSAASGGSNSTYIPDYVHSASGWCVAFVGGSWNGGLGAGLFLLGGNYTSSDTASYVGSRLLFLP